VHGRGKLSIGLILDTKKEGDEGGQRGFKMQGTTEKLCAEHHEVEKEVERK